jgi:hypothetical protein
MQKTICTKELLSNNLESKKLLSVYSDVWYTLNQVMVKELIEKNYLELPILGCFKIVRFKRKIKIKENGKPNLPIDWIKTKRGWREGTLKSDKFIYYTRNWAIKIVWSKTKVKNIKVYSFKPSRTNGGKCNTGMINQLWAYLAEQDTNYLKIPMIN